MSADKNCATCLYRDREGDCLLDINLKFKCRLHGFRYWEPSPERYKPALYGKDLAKWPT